jgi:hypothetical protein
MKAFVLPALVGALLASGCGGTSTPAAPSDPAPAAMVETFSGSVTASGADSHNFTVTQMGAVDITLTSVTPDDTKVGVAVGTPSGLSCFVITSVTTQAGQAPQLRGIGLAGPLCVLVYDIGGIVDPVTYTVTVAHP